MKYAGKAPDEDAVLAQDLNQSFLGLLFGYDGDGVALERRVTAIDGRFLVAP